MTAPSFSLTNRRALVTGANSGIGRAIAIGLAEAGADLVLHHFDDPGGAEAVRETVSGIGCGASVLDADFTRPGAAASLARQALGDGPIDILVANAAIERRGAWEALEDAVIGAHVAANFTSLLQLAGTLVPPMAARGWGRVVAIGSVLATRPRAETVVYASLKSAQLTAVRALARDSGPRGVTMNIVSPGAIETERAAGRYADPDFRKGVVAKIPAGRAGRPEDCVGPVIFLCSDAAAYVTGADIPVDGGWTIGDAVASSAAA